MSQPVRAAVVGMGFMGKTHAAAYHAAEAQGFPCKLVAVCDPDPRRLDPAATTAGNIASQTGAAFDPLRVATTTSVESLLAMPVDLVSICTPTDTHVTLATAALRAGKHVLLEKPVALTSRDVASLAEVAAGSTGLCMPAMCIRFWPGWDWLRDCVRDHRFGALLSATFQRLGAGPSWSADFYSDHSRSGGALVDLHIHDADFIYWCFGKPDSVSSCGGPAHITTLYHYKRGPAHVVAEGAWDLSPSAGFRMKFLANFEHASAEFDLARTPRLSVHTADASTHVELPNLSGYDCQIRHMVEVIASGGRTLRATLEDAVAVTRMLESERESARAGCSRTVP